jgi:hypothetical protein
MQMVWQRCALVAVIWGLCMQVQCKPEDFDLKINVVRDGEVFRTGASFRLPLNACQAYRFITDYDAATQIPGVLSSQSTRIDKQRVRVERVLRERILFFPIDMHMVLEFTERPGKGTDFVQISGQAKSYQGAWRLEPSGSGTLFIYQTQSVPDSAMPGAVLEYFIKNRLGKSFEAMASAGAMRAVEPCEH